MNVAFVGRVRIIEAAQWDGNAQPFTVEVLNDETGARDERMEQKFGTAEEARAYANALTRLSPASGLKVPVVLEGGPRTQWSVSAVISFTI